MLKWLQEWLAKKVISSDTFDRKLVDTVVSHRANIDSDFDKDFVCIEIRKVVDEIFTGGIDEEVYTTIPFASFIRAFHARSDVIRGKVEGKLKRHAVEASETHTKEALSDALGDPDFIEKVVAKINRNQLRGDRDDQGRT